MTKCTICMIESNSRTKSYRNYTSTSTIDTQACRHTTLKKRDSLITRPPYSKISFLRTKHSMRLSSNTTIECAWWASVHWNFVTRTTICPWFSLSTTPTTISYALCTLTGSQLECSTSCQRTASRVTRPWPIKSSTRLRHKIFNPKARPSCLSGTKTTTPSRNWHIRSYGSF